MTTVTLAQPADFPAIAELIAHQNASPNFRCLHSHDGSAANVLKTMQKWRAEDSILFATMVDDAGQLIGVLGCEYDVELGRGWLWGPFAQYDESAPAQWMQTVTTLYSVLEDGLPFKPAQLDAFIEQPFQLGRELYEQIGYAYTKSAYVYVAPRPDHPRTIEVPAVPLTQRHAASFSALFDTIFPKTYTNGAAIVERKLGSAAGNEQEHVFVVTDDDRAVTVHAPRRLSSETYRNQGGAERLHRATGNVLGFNYAVVNESASEGYVEFIGVSPQARRRGIGKRVLLTGMDWLFNEKAMPQIGLTTDEDNTGAQHLYEQAGFRLDHTGLNYRKTIQGKTQE